MACLTTSRRTELRARLASREASLALALVTYDELLTNGIESYRFDSTEGEQQTKRRKLGELKDQIDALESEIDQINNKLNGRGISNMNLRRAF